MNKIDTVALCFGFLVATLLFSSSHSIARNQADIVDIQVARERENLEVSFRIQNCFTPQMEEAVRSGVRTTFRILLVLEKKGFPLFRPRLLDITLERTIKYDRLKNEFKVRLHEHPDKVFITSDFDEAKRWMSSIENLPVIPLWRLKTGRPYQLSLKAELSKIQLPLYFRYIFFFVSLWDFETEWKKETFVF